MDTTDIHQLISLVAGHPQATWALLASMLYSDVSEVREIAAANPAIYSYLAP